jgi:hypothetical protein
MVAREAGGPIRTLTMRVRGVEALEERRHIWSVGVGEARRVRVIVLTMRARGGGAILRGEVCPTLRILPSSIGQRCPLWILLTGVFFLGLLQDTVMASDFSYPITSPWGDQRGSSYGPADLDPVEEVMITLDLAKETLAETLFPLIFSRYADGWDVCRYLSHFVPFSLLFGARSCSFS